MPNKKMAKNKEKVEALKKELVEIRQQKKEFRTLLSGLTSREREVMLQLEGLVEKRWDSNTPLYELVRKVYIDDFRQMLTKWEKCSESHFPIKTAHRFEFSPGAKKSVLCALNEAMSGKSPTFFIVSDRSLYRYLESHTNLGHADSIKKALQRLR